MNKSFARIYVILATIIMLIVSITLGYLIGQAKRETMIKEREIQELKNEFKKYKKQ